MNNLKTIKLLLEFKSEDDFYHLQIIKRKKENPEIGSNSEVIKTYYITSTEHLEKKMSEITSLCNLHNARAYINLNVRSFESAAFHMLKKVTDIIMNKDYKSVRNAYESVCGSLNTRSKKWIIDVDVLDFEYCLQIAEEIKKIEGSNILGYIPTKNGWHIICEPFNTKLIEPFQATHAFDIHKNNPTILYTPGVVPPEHGGCWFCHDDKGDDLVFDWEFDTYVHLNCLKKVLEENPEDQEAKFMSYLLNSL